jgi:hypothetical protein
LREPCASRAKDGRGATEGGWGIAGTAFGREEFAALAARAKGG